MPHSPKFLSTVIFFILFTAGLILAAHRPLWNDELYTVVSSVHSLSYGKIFAGQVDEGNNCPLFYLMQKALAGLAGYQVPAAWLQGQWDVRDFPSQILLRLVPDLFMSLALTVIFYFFALRFSVVTAFLSLFLGLTNQMVWWYWVEARPYALWVFLTAAQAVVFLEIILRSGEKRPVSGLWRLLAGVHLLLSLTVVFGAVQAAVACALLWAWGHRRWTDYSLLLALPVLITAGYYSQAPRYPLWFHQTPEQLIRDSISRDRFYIFYLYLAALAVFGLQRMTGRLGFFRGDALLKAVPFAALTAGMLLSAAAVLALLLGKASESHAGFPVSNRYFIYLAPVGVIAATLAIHSVWQSLDGKIWARLIFLSGTGYLLAHRLWKVIPSIAGHYPGVFSP
ncbi:MAG: hypothetical protein Q8Q08_02000 [Candidatus Omnitrophota bacterium]|nr:hypothetical protein [Candidatus Omnitrophota bacterium]MDZ4241992.1 hypothetical protein [Candidatus Omnitrophota bacterium]